MDIGRGDELGIVTIYYGVNARRKRAVLKNVPKFKTEYILLNFLPEKY